VSLATVLPDVDELDGRTDVIYVGGPVARERIVLLMRSAEQPGDSGRVFEDTYVSSSLAALKQMVASPHSGDTFHAFAGYAGWAPGQLDGEVSRGDWHISPARQDLVFDKEAADIWPELIEKNSGLWVRRVGSQLRIATGNR
jgi:putative transcriptional regulator